jgi:hypothetical protein
MSQFNSTSYQGLRVVTGTDEQPLQVRYYKEGRLTITIISSDATTPQITTSTSHGLKTGDSVFISDSDSIAVVDGSHTVIYISSTEFTISGVDTTTSAGTAGFVYSEKTLVHQVDIDSYLNNIPSWKGQSLPFQQLNLAEARFEPVALSNDASNLLRVNGDARMMPYLDPAFTAVTSPGHTNVLSSILRDVNNTTNTKWLNVTLGTTLSVVSTSALDAFPFGTGIGIILLDGLDENLDVQQETVVMAGTTPIVTTSLWRGLNNTIAVFGGPAMTGAAGKLTVTSVEDGSQWARYLEGETAGPTGRFTVPNGARLLLHHLFVNGGIGGDQSVRVNLQPLGGYQINLGELYAGSGGNNESTGNFAAFFEAGTTIAFSAQSNSGNPFQRRLSVSMVGSWALVADWDKYKFT